MKQDFKFTRVTLDVGYSKQSKLKRFMRYVWYQIMPIVGIGFLIREGLILMRAYNHISNGKIILLIALPVSIFIYLLMEWLNKT